MKDSYIISRTYLKLIAFSLLLGCVSPNTENASNESDLVNELSVIDTIFYDDLTIMDGDLVIKNYYMLDNQLYSGQAVKYEMANDGRWSFVHTIENGILQRLDVLGVNGYQHRFVEMVNGYNHHTVMFHRNGKRYIEEYYDKNKNRVGIWSRWYESGELEWNKKYN
jgi:hypothetical protein